MGARRALLLLALLILCGSSAAYSGKNKDAFPLYQDPSGWQILRGIPGDRITSKISVLSSEALDWLGKRVPITEKRYILEHSPSTFYCFVMEIPATTTLLWDVGGALTLTYLSGRDTLRTTSSECFFSTTTTPNKLIFTWELQSPLVLPNSMLVSDGPACPAVFAKFPFKEFPDRLLACTVTNVRSYRKEANGQ